MNHPVEPEMKTVKLGDLINEAEVYKLRKYAASTKDSGLNLHKRVVSWIASQPQLEKRLAEVGEEGMIPEYAAYVFIYYLNIED